MPKLVKWWPLTYKDVKNWVKPVIFQKKTSFSGGKHPDILKILIKLDKKFFFIFILLL